MVVHGVRDRGKTPVVEVEWEASVDVDHFTVEFIRTRVGREGLGHTLPWLLLCAPFVLRVSVNLRPRHVSSGDKELEYNQSSKPNKIEILMSPTRC